jgi:signal transduction histidine kinase
MSSAPNTNLRILLVDDNPAIHEDFRRILAPENSPSDLDADAAALFDVAPELPATKAGFELDSAYQGQEARDMTIAACNAGRPYALAFVDMRMPPGWDGLVTIGKLWEIDPELNVVICTAHSDHSWEEIQAALPVRERWLVLKKPFDKIEVLQLAHALTEKWNLTRLANAQRATLERMVDARTEQLQRALRVKNEFLANVSHELLTPMNGVLGMLEVLAEDGSVGGSGRDCLEEARRSGENLLRLMQQILAFNQAEAGTLALDPVEFTPAGLVREVLDVYRARATHKRLQLAADIDANLVTGMRAPAPVIRQILLALVDNAVKFTSVGSVTLSVRSGEGRLVFSVRDTGIGLSAEQLDWIALPFAQVDGGTSRRNSGIGLGLPLAKRLATSLGGELTLTGHPGGGTTAEFSVLLSPSLAQAAG